VADESAPSARQKVVILGGGPNRIGQGIEFDYCCCHAAFALDEAGKSGKPRRDRDAFYLNDQGEPIKVRDNERSLGVPTVRLEITF